VDRAQASMSLMIFRVEPLHRLEFGLRLGELVVQEIVGVRTRATNFSVSSKSWSLTQPEFEARKSGLLFVCGIGSFRFKSA
jgi:hypothetical protein